MASGRPAPRPASTSDTPAPDAKDRHERPAYRAPGDEAGSSREPRHHWLLLAYKVPRNPSVNRVTIWRKLKRLGALLLNDAAWVLPATPFTTEQFQWLAVEIQEMGGDYTLWSAELILDGQEQGLIDRFDAQVEGPYRTILAALRRKNPDLAALSRQYQQIRAQDYFQSGLGKRVFEALAAARGAKR